MVDEGRDAAHQGGVACKLVVVADGQLRAARLDEVQVAVDLAGPVASCIDRRNEGGGGTGGVIDDAAAADGGSARQQVAEDLRVAIELQRAAGRDHQGVVVVAGRGRVHPRRGEAVEERVVRGGGGELQRAEADGRESGIVVTRGGIEQQLAVTGLGQPSGGRREDAAEGGVGRQGVGRAHHVHEERARIRAAVTGVD